jgi:cytochrome b561
MQFRNTSGRFGLVAKTFHWLTLALLIGSFTLALTMIDLPLSPRKLQLYSWHKWFGVTVFLVTILRLGWRLLDPAPEQLARMPRWQRRLAGLSHATLYAVLIIMPLTGWVMSSALNLPLVYLGIIYVPSPFGVDSALGESMKLVHGGLAIALLVLVGVHVAAALYHQVILRDDVLRRMLPWPSWLRMSRAGS